MPLTMLRFLFSLAKIQEHTKILPDNTLFLGDDEETETEAGAASAAVSENVANFTSCDVVVYLPKFNMNHAANERELEKIVTAMTGFGEIAKQVQWLTIAIIFELI